MTRYNPSFELTVADVDLIETALHQTKDVLSKRHLSREHLASLEGAGNNGKAQDLSETMQKIHDLLGKLHNQKVFFRPQNEVYLGG